MPYYGLFIPTGNKRDTKAIMEKLKEVAPAWLATYEEMVYGEINPCSFDGIKIIDNPEWMKRRML